MSYFVYQNALFSYLLVLPNPVHPIDLYTAYQSDYSGSSSPCSIPRASISPYVEFLMNSRLKKFLFVVDAVFCFLEETESLFVRLQLDGRHESTW